MAVNYRLNAWFQSLNDDDRTEDDLEAEIMEALKDRGLICQGGPVVFKVKLPLGG